MFEVKEALDTVISIQRSSININIVLHTYLHMPVSEPVSEKVLQNSTLKIGLLQEGYICPICGS